MSIKSEAAKEEIMDIISDLSVEEIEEIIDEMQIFANCIEEEK